MVRRATSTGLRQVTAVVFAVCVAGCDRSPAPPKPPPSQPGSVYDIPAPQTSSPPVQAASYDAGYRAGDVAGEAAVKVFRTENPRQRPPRPTEHELDVLALAAAGSDPERGPKWQRGYAAGYRDGFMRAAEGKK